MALRIGGGKKLPPVDAKMAPAPEAPPTEVNAADEGDTAAEGQAPQDVPPDAPPDDADGDETQGSGVLDPVVAGYKGPEMGPFMCANCHHFSVRGPNTCEIVAGPIDQAGICNVYTPLATEGASPQDTGGEAPPEAMPPTDEQPPTEAPPEEQPPTQ